MASSWGELDQDVGRLLDARRVVAAQEQGRLYAYGVERRLEHGGSVLLGAALERGLVTAQGAESLLRLLSGGKGNTRVDATGPFSGHPPASGSTHGTFGMTPGGSGTFGMTPGASGTFGMTPGASGTFGMAPSSAGPAPDGTRSDDTFAEVTSSGDAERTYMTTHGTRAGASAARHASAPPPAPVERYTLVRHVSPDEVEVIDARVGRPVMLRLQPTEGGDASTKRYLRHARLLAQLDHPSVIQVHDIGTYGGRTFYSVDRLDGETLTNTSQRRQILLRAFLKLAGAIVHAHGQGLAHTHLHPDSVVIGSFGRVWVTGWEMARVLPEATSGVRSAAADDPGGAPRHTLGAHSAPELHAGKAPGASTDVWGLGVILHWMLCGALPKRGADVKISRRAGLPRELSAIVEHSLRRRPSDRYASALALLDDVRRFLDGRAVAVVRDSLLRASVRFVRRNRFAGGILVTTAALLLCGGALVFAVFAAQLDAARAEELKAEAAHQEALLGEAAAQALVRTAHSKRQIAEGRRRLEDAVSGAAQTEQGFEEAERLLDALVDVARASSAEDPGSDGRGQGPEHLERELQVRSRLARARYFLERARPPDPRRALADYKAVIRHIVSGPRDIADDPIEPENLAEAQFGAFIAARRLPGAAAQEDERAALNDLARLRGPLARAARIELQLRPLEARAEQLAQQNPPVLIGDDAEAKALYVALSELAQERRDLALVHEQLGRFFKAMTGPGVHRGVQVNIDGRLAKIEGGRTWYPYAYQQFFHAMYLDPLEPTPRFSFMRALDSKFGRHAFTQWKGAWSFDQLVRASKLTPRVEPLLEVVEQMHALGREPSSLALLKRLPRFEAPRQPELPARAAIYEARAKLTAGLPVSEEFDALEVPGELRGQHQILRGWRHMVGGRLQAGLESVLEGMRGVRDFQRAYRDLVNALLDPRIDARALVSLLSQRLPPPPEYDAQPLVWAMLLARGTLRARLGEDGRGDLQRLRPAPWARQFSPFDWYGGKRELAMAQSLASVQPGNPMPHVVALQYWAYTNMDTVSNEPHAYAFRDLIVQRLRALGQSAAADQFASVEAVDEIWVRRYWVPPEGHAWKAR